MEYPIFDIKISLKEIFTIISIIFILIVLAFFVIWFHFLKKYLIKPINSLVGHKPTNGFFSLCSL